jgi:hypothetical protein
VRRSRATSFYVYYRIAADTREARERVEALIEDVAARTGVRGNLSARTDDPTTWMELYAPVEGPASFRRVLASVAHAHNALALTVDGTRHVEQFAPLPPLPKRRKA